MEAQENKKNKTSSKQQNGNDFTDDVWRSAFNREKKKLPKGKYKYVYSYELPTGEIVYQSYIPKYKWSAYHDSEKKAAIAVDMFLINKGEEPINVLVRK